jgi:hypothetical protein
MTTAEFYSAYHKSLKEFAKQNAELMPPQSEMVEEALQVFCKKYRKRRQSIRWSNINHLSHSEMLAIDRILKYEHTRNYRDCHACCSFDDDEFTFTPYDSKIAEFHSKDGKFLVF